MDIGIPSCFKASNCYSFVMFCGSLSLHMISWNNHWSWTESIDSKPSLFFGMFSNLHWCEMNRFTAGSLLRLRPCTVEVDRCIRNRSLTQDGFQPQWLHCYGLSKIQLLQCQCSRLQVNLGVLFNPLIETDDPLGVHPNNSRTVFYFLLRLYGFPWNFRCLCMCIPKFPHLFSSIIMFIIRFFRSQSDTWHQADHWPHRSIIRILLHSNFRMWRN